MSKSSSPRRVTSLAQACTVVVAAAMAACWMHLVTVAAMRHLFGMFSWKWWIRDQVLLSSLGYLLVFAIVSIVPVALHALWPRILTLARLAGVEASLASFAVLLLFQRLAPWALGIVAIAIGVQVVRLLQDREERLLVWSRRVATIGVAVSAVVASTTLLFRAASERRELGALTPAPAGMPNVLLLILDTVRASSLGLYGGPVDNTPLLAGWARRGVVFENAYSTASWTLPSHASIFTGLYASHAGADWSTPLGPGQATLAEVLRRQGLATGGFVANTVATGYYTGLSRGFIHYDDIKLSLTEALLSTTLTQTKSLVGGFIEWQTSGWMRQAVGKQFPFSLRPHGNYVWHDQILADEVSGDFLDWQGGLGGRPFFAFLNFFDAHDPYLPPARYRTMYGGQGLAKDRYLGAIRYMDGSIDRVLRTLEERGVLRNTIVVITADHGESFGEHSLNGHGNGLFREQIRVPLVIVNAPGLAPGTRVRPPVSLRDLAATVLDLTGVTASHSLGGTSLRSLVASGNADGVSPVIAELSRGINGRPQSFIGRADQKTVVTERMHVIQSNLQTLNIFDFQHDSLELVDLATQAAPRTAGLDLITRTLKTNRITWRTPR